MASLEMGLKKPPLRAYWRTRALDCVLLCLLLLGLALRFYNLRWDESALLHPDERFLAGLVFRVGWPAPDQWFHSGLSALNPHNLEKTHYVYGQFPLILGKAWAAVVGARTDAEFLFWGRMLSGLFDGVTVLCALAVGRRLFGLTLGLAVGALASLAPLGIQASHFFTVDSFAAAFLALSWVCALYWVEAKRSWAALACGAAWGLALSCKLSSFPALLTLVPLYFLLVKDAGRVRALTQCLLALLAAFVALRLFHPMGFRGEILGGFLDIRLEPRFWSEVSAQALITSGKTDVPFNVQWIGRWDYLYPLHNLGAWGWGWPLLLLGMAGIFCYPLFPMRKCGSVSGVMWLLWTFGVASFLIYGSQFSKFTRYYLALTPIVAIFAMYQAELLLRRSRQFGVLLPATVFLTACWGVAVATVYSGEHTRLRATRWIWANVPPGSVVSNETAWDEALPLAWIPGPQGQAMDRGLYRLNLDVFAPDDASKRSQLLANLDASSYLFLSSPRAWSTIPRWRERWPVTSAFYDQLFTGQLGYSLVEEFTSYPRLGPLVFPDDRREEALSVYDHPRVLIFQKNETWSYSRADALLPAALPVTDRQWEPARAVFSGPGSRPPGRTRP